MNSSEVAEIINIIRGTSSTLGKLSILKEAVEFEEFRHILKLAYDPLIRFNIRAYAKYDSALSLQFDKSTYQLFDDLAIGVLSGDAAREAVARQYSLLSSLSRVLFDNILQKDLRAGINKELINKAYPGLIPDLPYMRCSLPKKPLVELLNYSKGVICQVKADGMFCAIYYNSNDDIVLYTRQCQTFPNDQFKDIIDFLKNTDLIGNRLDGELRVRRNGKILGRTEGNGILTSVLKGGSFAKDEEPFYTAWDCINLYGVKYNKQSLVSYGKRLDQLLDNIQYDIEGPVEVILSCVVFSADEAKSFFDGARAMGEEGTIEKLPDGIWKDGVSTEQFKRKPEFECELRIIALNPGKGKNENSFGSFLCVSECGELSVSVSGLTDAFRNEVFKQWRTVNSLEGKIITVRFKELVKDKKTNTLSLFEPRFVEVRIDKVEANTLTEIKEIANEN